MPVEHAFWHGLSAHFIHLEASVIASFSVYTRLWKSLVQFESNYFWFLLNFILFSCRYFYRSAVLIT